MATAQGTLGFVQTNKYQNKSQLPYSGSVSSNDMKYRKVEERSCQFATKNASMRISIERSVQPVTSLSDGEYPLCIPRCSKGILPIARQLASTFRAASDATP